MSTSTSSTPSGFGIILHDFLEGPWEQARGVLKEELDQFRGMLNALWNKNFGADGNLTGLAITGDFSTPTRYVSNTGVKSQPKWDQVNLSNGVKNRLPFTHIVQSDASRLLGRGSASSGDYQPITVGAGLAFTGTVLNTTGGTVQEALTLAWMGL